MADDDKTGATEKQSSAGDEKAAAIEQQPPARAYRVGRLMKALQHTSNVEKDGSLTVIRVGEIVPDDHPLVALHPHMFESV